MKTGLSILMENQPYLFFFCLTLIAITLHEVFRTNRVLYSLSERHFLLGKWPIPKISFASFRWFSVLFITCLLLCVLNIHTRLVLLISMALYFILFSQLGHLSRKTNLYPFILFFYVVLPKEESPFFSTLWTELFIKTTISLVYFSSFLQKIKYAPSSWLNGNKIKQVIYYHDQLNDTEFRVFFNRFPLLYPLIGVITLLFEGLFWTSVLFPSLSFFYGGTAILFHLFIFASLKINYLKYYIPVLAVYFY